MKNKIFMLSLIAAIFSSCEKINLEKADTNVPVVEAYIVPGDTVSIKIIKQLVYNSGDTSVNYLNGLDVTISDGTTSYPLINTDTGMYISSEMEISAQKEYILEFEYNGKLVTSETIIPTKPEGFTSSTTTFEVFSFSGGFTPGSFTRPEPETLSWSNPNGEYHMVVVESIEENPTAINESDMRPPRAFRNAPVQGSETQLNPMSFTYYGKHILILFKLNTEYAALYEQLGSNSLDITAPPSNVKNGLGIFTGINSDTIFVNVVSQ